MSEEKQKISKYKKLILIIIVLIIVITILLYITSGKITQTDTPDYKSYYINTCKEGVYNKTTSNSYKCVAETNFYADKAILLNNDKVLLYNSDLKNAALFDPKINKITTIPINISRLNNMYIDHILLPVNKYLIMPDVIYDEKNNEFKNLNDNQINKYLSFIKTRKYEITNTFYLTVFNNKYILYVGNNKKNGTNIWLEDPVNLKRSKYGNLNNIIKNFTQTLLNKELTATMLDNNKLLLIKAPDLFLFTPETGEILQLDKLEYLLKDSYFLDPNYKLKAIQIKKQELLISNSSKNKLIVYNMQTKTQKLVIDKGGCFLKNQSWVNNNDFKLLNNGKVFIYGPINALYNPDNNEMNCIEDIYEIRINANLINLNNNVFISGGYLTNIYSELAYKTIELFKVDFTK